MLRWHKLSVTCSGVDGSATGSDTTKGTIVGRVVGVYLDYSAGQAASTVVTIASVQAPVVTILTVTTNKTDGWYYPRHQVHSAAGAALTLDGTRIMVEPPPVVGQIKVTVTLGNSAETVDAWLLTEE